MMNMPSWLTALTGGQQFANNPANGFRATFGDGLQGIGHSMMEHYRGTAGANTGGVQGLDPAILALIKGGGQPQVNGGPGAEMGMKPQLQNVQQPQVNGGGGVTPFTSSLPQTQNSLAQKWGSLAPLFSAFNRPMY